MQDQPILETKKVKHVFTIEERDAKTTELLNALDAAKNAEMEFEGIKQTYKARIAEAESRHGALAAILRAGFELRDKECLVKFRPDVRLKDFCDPQSGEVLLTEQMTDADFQQELLQAESAFEHREEIELFPPANDDFGILVVGQMDNRWFSALRINVGAQSTSERLDSEQKSFKKRFDAISTAAKRALTWFKDNMKDAAKGFEQPIQQAVEAQKERVE